MVGLLADGTADGIALRTGADRPRSVLPVGTGGVHFQETSVEGHLNAHFRAAAARLLHPEEANPERHLVLAGHIVHASYPGDLWRYTVEVDGSRFIIDDEAAFGIGTETRVAIPAAALHLFRPA